MTDQNEQETRVVEPLAKFHAQFRGRMCKIEQKIFNNQFTN